MLLVYFHFSKNQKKQDFCVLCAGKKEASGNVVVQVWNGGL